MHPNLVSVRLMCGGCGEPRDWCVRIDRNVPEPLRCPGGRGGAPVTDSPCRDPLAQPVLRPTEAARRETKPDQVRRLNLP